MRKKLFAILMSAMMMVTFMPMMAFAAETTDGWASDYSKWTKGGVEFKVTKYLYDEGNSSGLQWRGRVVAVADTSDSALAGDKIYAIYYDLNLVELANDIPSVIKDTQIATYFGSGVLEPTVEKDLKMKAFYSGSAVNIEGGVYGYKMVEKTALGATEATWNNSSNLKGTIATPDYDSTNPYTAQEFTLPITMTTDLGTKVAGSIAAKKITVMGKDILAADAKYTVDEKVTTGSSDTLTVDYNGAVHTLAQKELPGVTSTFKTYDATTKTWVDASSVEIKDVMKEALSVKATAVKGTDKNERTLTGINVVAADAPVVDFKDSDASHHHYFVVGKDFKAEDYLTYTVTSTRTGDAKTAKEAADKLAVAANKDLLTSYMKDFYEINTTVDEFTGLITAKLEAKKTLNKLTTAERDALIAKYSTLLRNFGEEDELYRNAIVTPVFVTGTPTATFEVSQAIDWVKAPLTKKYYNKKGTLAKTYTFAVEAEGAYKVTYTLSNGGSMIKIDKNTGKVTVKKGLKVGTYTVKITAKSGNDTDFYYMTIKMAKKK